MCATVIMKNDTSFTGANIGRIFLAVFLLFLTWAVAGYLSNIIWPKSAFVGSGGGETIAGKVGCSIGILIASLAIRRYLLRSFVLMLVCLALTEIIVLVIIICFTGLTRFAFSDIRFNAWWLYALTWNVVAAFLIGTVVGQFWEKLTASKPTKMS